MDIERKAGRGDAPGGRGKDQGAVHGSVRAAHGTEPRGGDQELGGLAEMSEPGRLGQATSTWRVGS